MLKYSLTKGLLLGLLAGILTTIFDSLYMLSPDNIHIPYVYPFALVTFNAFFWSAIGFFAGFAQWLFCKSSANFLKKEHLCWIVFFLLPLNPLLPADAQVITFPFGSVIEIIVLLNVEWIQANPRERFIFFFPF